MSKSNGWSPERRERQRRAIQNWQPWTRSTGPRTNSGKAGSSQNARRLPMLIEAEAFIRLLVLEREQVDILIGEGDGATSTRADVLADEISALRPSIDPNGDFAHALAAMPEDYDAW